MSTKGGDIAQRIKPLQICGKQLALQLHEQRAVMNRCAAQTIYLDAMERTARTFLQSILAPGLTGRRLWLSSAQQSGRAFRKAGYGCHTRSRR